MRAVATLHVEAGSGFLRYRLDLPESDLAEPLQEEFRQAIDEPTLRALRDNAARLLRSPERADFADEARRRGAVLYRTLIPLGLRAPLRAVRVPLLVSTSIYGIPWELLHDDEQFWGLRYALGKRLITSRTVPAAGGRLLRGHPRALIVGSNPRRDLPFVRGEVDRLCEALEESSDITCVTDDMATFDAVTAYLGEGFDLIHYCGHVVDGSDGAALLLAGEVPLAAEVIRANLAGRPLVVLNGCASARGTVAGPSDGWEEALSSVAHGFLFGGALAVVGTQCDVSDAHAATVAEAFYRRVLAPVPIGEALRTARERCLREPGGADSPSWLGFVLYGNPARSLFGDEATDPADAPRTPVLPVEPTARLRARSWRGSALPGLLLLAVLLVVAAMAGRLKTKSSIRAEGPLVLGVMEVRSRSAAVPAWMREITRDSLSTILSKVDGLRVYSRQKIDFVRRQRKLSEIEAAETLGMTKMLSATLALDASRVILELQVVDIASGLLDASDVVQGPPARLIELQNELALRAMEALGVRPPPDRLKEVLGDRTNDSLDGYRMLMETLGGPGDANVPAAPLPDGGSSGLVWGSVAWAAEPSAAEAAIRGLLARWATTLEAKNIQALAAIEADMSELQRAALGRYFANAQNLQIRISDVEVMVDGDEALATFTRSDTFTDARSGRETHLQLRINGDLVLEGGLWKIRSLRNPS